MGDWFNGEMHGKGIYTFTNGERYEGEWKNNMKNGNGKYFYIDGRTEAGKWENNKMHGEFIRTTRDNNHININETIVFQNNFLLRGINKFKFGNGDEYRGSWIDGKMDSQGTMFYANGDRYVGSWISGKMHGQGTMFYANGDKYAGSWINGKMDGRGIITYVDGNEYEGIWEMSEHVELIQAKKNNIPLEGNKEFNFRNGDRYEGNWINGKMHGQGTMFYANRNKYKGNWINGMKDGFGEMEYQKENEEYKKYEGFWREGSKDGKGTLTLSCGSYEGNWKKNLPIGEFIYTDLSGNLHDVELCDEEEENEYVYFGWQEEECPGKYYKGDICDGYKNGFGILTFSDGRVYKGSWGSNKMHGYGVLTEPNGEKYEGEWDYNKKMHGEFIYTDSVGNKSSLVYQENSPIDGKREFTFKNNNKYDGDWVKGKMDGIGIMEYTDGSRYTGNWVANQRKGEGKLTLEDGSFYEGLWQDDKKNGKFKYTDIFGNESFQEWKNGKIVSGFAIIVDANGDEYYGNWENGKKHGQGSMEYADGKRYEGEWENDRWHGQGTLTYDNGKIYIGQFTHGKKTSLGKYIFTRKYYKSNFNHIAYNQDDSSDEEDTEIKAKDYSYADAKREFLNKNRLSEDCDEQTRGDVFLLHALGIKLLYSKKVNEKYYKLKANLKLSDEETHKILENIKYIFKKAIEAKVKKVFDNPEIKINNSKIETSILQNLDEKINEVVERIANIKYILNLKSIDYKKGKKETCLPDIYLRAILSYSNTTKNSLSVLNGIAIHDNKKYLQLEKRTVSQLRIENPELVSRTEDEESIFNKESVFKNHNLFELSNSDKLEWTFKNELFNDLLIELVYNLNKYKNKSEELGGAKICELFWEEWKKDFFKDENGITRKCLEGDYKFSSKNVSDFLANLRLSNRSQTRSIKNLTDTAQNGISYFKTWEFSNKYKIIEEQEITNNYARKDQVKNKNLGGTYKKIYEQISILSITDSELAKDIRSVINGNPLSNTTHLELIHNISYLIFGCEVVRNPASLFIHQMALDLIISEKLTWEEVLTVQNSTDDDKRPPMFHAGKDAVKTARGLQKILNPYMPHHYKYHGESLELQTSAKKLPAKRGSYLIEMAKQESKIFRLWCESQGKAEASEAEIIRHIINKTKEWFNGEVLLFESDFVENEHTITISSDLSLSNYFEAILKNYKLDSISPYSEIFHKDKKLLCPLKRDIEFLIEKSKEYNQTKVLRYYLNILKTKVEQLKKEDVTILLVSEIKPRIELIKKILQANLQYFKALAPTSNACRIA